MIIISHRGFWEKKHEQNTLDAFKRSFERGFGVETDVRDFNGELVISHDIPVGGELSFEDFLALHRSYGGRLVLALNVKSDGLQDKMNKLLQTYNVSNYFVFDMSIPDTLGYLKRNMNVFSRHSEYEPSPSFYPQANGIWLDEFDHHWISNETISSHFLEKKDVCIVSPELHGREYALEWEEYKKMEQNTRSTNSFMLCTDHPTKAYGFFCNR